MTPAVPGRLHAWGLLVARRRRVVLAVWAVLIAAGLVFVPRLASSLSMTGLWVPGSQSSRAAALLARDLPAAGGNQAVLVFSSRTLTAADPRFQRVVTAAARKVSAIRGVRGVELPSGAAARALVAPGGRTALAVVALGSDEGSAEKLAPRLAAAAAAAATPAVRVGVTGEPRVAHGLFNMLEADLVKSDAVGLPVALLVLLVVFASLVAAGLPLLLALASLGITLGTFGAISLLTGGGFNMVLESATVVLALGIGIDYALFVVTRFREELAGGNDPAEAAAAATATAGRTVLVSGSTVILALAPVLLVNDPMMRQVVAGPMLAVAVLAAAALSLLPATLAGLGPRVSRLAPPLPRLLRRPAQPRAASRLSALLLRRPLVVLASAGLPLAALSVFTLQLHTGLDYGLNTLSNTPAGRADTAIAAAFGPGAISPVQVVFTTAGQPLTGRDLRTLAVLDARLRRDPRVASVTDLPALADSPAAAVRALAAARTDPALAAQLAPVINAAHGATVTLMTVVPRTAFDSAQAAQLVTGLRRELPGALRGTGMHALVGGASAAIADFGHEISAKTPLVLAIIIALAFVLLAAAFRSPIVALIGLAGTLLSVGAAYGLLVLVFQKGAGQAILGFQSPGYIQDWLPLFLLAVLVGLSTDYQVFLISRVKEEWEHSHDPARAITAGLQRSGPVILSAATIMVIVFASFLLARVFEIKELGFALAAVVLIDAALTRRLLVPAALRLLGNHAWTHPRLHAPRRRRPLMADRPDASRPRTRLRTHG
ncbi:MAG TPA: MMPL family transporter [Streptosporangiaceae bacterium]|nr:MMPL family transporter [Streptosporangiaceae bacterium]